MTGHTGFKGAWLSLLLGKLQIQQHGFALRAEKDSLYERLNLEKSYPSWIGDIRDLVLLRRCLSQTQPSSVIHMAAQPLVLKSYKEPLETFETNVIGTTNLLQAAFDTPSVKAILVVTTDKVYRNDGSGKRFKEEDPLQGHDPYSASKVGTEAVCAAWQKIASVSGGPKVIVARAGNVIGGGDFAADRIIPDIIRSVLSKKDAVIRNPLATRPWQHVLDPLIGYLQFLDASISGTTEVKALNFGPFESSLKVGEILKVAQEVFGNRFQFSIKDFEETIEASTLELDASLARTELGWNPRWTQKQAILDTFLWWKKVIENGSYSNVACREDIDFLLSGENINR